MRHSDLPMRDDTAKHIKEVRKILKQGLSCDCSGCESQYMSQELDSPPVDRDKMFSASMLFICLLTGALLMIASCQTAHAEMIEGHDIQVWANAIGKAENSPSHPYGIMARFKHTSPRQACINTVRHQYRIWCKSACSKPFLTFLASKYAPLGAFNDPTGLNRHWAKNVEYFLERA